MQYYNQNQGIVTGSAFFNSFMKSYGNSLAMQADIERFRSQQLRSQESRDYARQRMDLSVLSSQRYARDELRKAKLEFAKATDADKDSFLGEGEESERTRQARENLEVLQQTSEPGITGIGRSAGPSKNVSLTESAGRIADTFMSPDEYAERPAAKEMPPIVAKPKKKMSFRRLLGSVRKKSALIKDIDTWDKPATKIKGIGKIGARELYDMADDVDLGNFAEIRKAVPGIQDILLEDPEGAKRLFGYLKAGKMPDGRPFGTQEAIALLRQLQGD